MRRLSVLPGSRYLVLFLLVITSAMPLVSPATAAQSKPLVYPGVVAVQEGTCVNGVITPATVSVPSDTTTDAIFYTITQPDAEGNFSVHAQVGDSNHLGAAPGWSLDNVWNAYYNGVAPIPNCDGPQQVETGDADEPGDSDVPDMGVFALPQDCGSIPYPAPTGDDVTDVVSFSNFVITQGGVPHTGGAISLTSPNEVLTLEFDWTATAPVAAGQYFYFAGPLDTNGNKVFTSATQWFPVMNFAGTAQAGCASVVGGDIIVQFTNYVNPLAGVGGGIDLFVEMAAGSTEESNTIDFAFDNDSVFSIEIPGTPSGDFGKRGWFMRSDQGLVENLGAIRWQLHVPASSSGYTNLVLADYASEDGSWTFSCAGPLAADAVVVASGSQGPVAVSYTEECSADAMTLTVASVPAGVSLDFYFYADITPGMEGPFYNIASAQADEFERIELPYEVRRTVGSGIADGSYAVLPVPPAVNHAVCVNDEWIPASVILPTGQEGVTYSMTPNPFPAEGGYVVVTATLAESYIWAAGAASNGWVLDESTGAMVYEADVTNTPCVEKTPTPTPPPAITPTPEVPCVPPTPEECIPTPTPEGGTPTAGTETPEPCVTPTVPAWCLETPTPTPPTVTELPETGRAAENGHGTNLLVVAGLTLMIGVAFATTHRLRSR